MYTTMHALQGSEQAVQLAAKRWEWLCAGAARTAAGELISWMLQPVGERCTLEQVKQEPFFRQNLPEQLLMMTNSACSEEISTERRNSFLTDIRDIVYVSRKPSMR